MSKPFSTILNKMDFLKDFKMYKNLVSIVLNLGSKLKLFVRYLFPKIGQTKLRIPNLNYLRKTTSTSASRLCVGHFALKMGFCCLINNGLVVAAKNVCHPFHNGAQKFKKSQLHLQFCSFMEHVQGCHHKFQTNMTANSPLCSCCRLLVHMIF